MNEPSGSVTLGYLAAIATAAACPSLFILTSNFWPGEPRAIRDPPSAALFTFGFAFLGFAMFTILPTAFFLWGARRYEFYGASTCIACGALQGGVYGLLVTFPFTLTIVGGLSGLVGWWVERKTRPPNE